MSVISIGVSLIFAKITLSVLIPTYSNKMFSTMSKSSKKFVRAGCCICGVVTNDRYIHLTSDFYDESNQILRGDDFESLSTFMPILASTKKLTC